MNTTSPISATEIGTKEESSYRYSICTLVSKPDEYREMLNSFQTAGFEKSFTEYLYIDNTRSNKYDGFSGLNKFLLEAQGKYIILCHQDILLCYDNLEVLEQRIKEIEELDPDWAIISNAGAVDIKNIVLKVTEPDGKIYTSGNFPSRVKSVDESFILVRREANLALSRDLSGFHLYGTDICIIAKILGFNSYVVNFNILHKSKGNVDQNFHDIKNDLIRKYISAFSGRYIQTTNTKFFISDSRYKNLFFNSRFMMFWARQYYKNKKRFSNPDIKRK